MTFSIFDYDETQTLIDAQDLAIFDLAKDFELTDAIKSKVASIVLKIGRRCQKRQTPMNANEIAKESILALACLKAPPLQSRS